MHRTSTTSEVFCARTSAAGSPASANAAWSRRYEPRMSTSTTTISGPSRSRRSSTAAERPGSGIRWHCARVEAPDVGFEQPLGQVSIPGIEGLEDGFVLSGQDLERTHRIRQGPERSEEVPGDGVAEYGHDEGEGAVTAASRQCDVEAHICVVEGVDVRIGGAHLVECLSGDGDASAGGIGAPHRLALEEQPEVDQVLQGDLTKAHRVLQGVGSTGEGALDGHTRASGRDGVPPTEEPLRLQDPERLSDRRSTHTELFGQLLFGREHGSVTEVARDDGFAQFP